MTLLGCNSAPPQCKIGPALVGQVTTARPLIKAECKSAAGSRINAAPTGGADRIGCVLRYVRQLQNPPLRRTPRRRHPAFLFTSLVGSWAPLGYKADIRPIKRVKIGRAVSIFGNSYRQPLQPREPISVSVRFGSLPAAPARQRRGRSTLISGPPNSSALTSRSVTRRPDDNVLDLLG